MNFWPPCAAMVIPILEGGGGRETAPNNNIDIGNEEENTVHRQRRNHTA